MEDGDARTYQRVYGFVEVDQCQWRIIASAPAITIEQDPPNTGSTQPLAFHGEKGEFVDRVETAEVSAEFEAVDDERRRSQKDMLGAQIAVALHDPALLGPLHQQPAATAHKGFDAASDVLGGVAQVSAAIVESPAARPAFGAKAVDIGPRLDIGMACRGKETGKARAERLNIGMAPIAAGETVVKHPFGGQPAHLDEPIDDIAGSGDHEAALAEGQGQDADIDVASQAAVEADFPLGIALPGVECG